MTNLNPAIIANKITTLTGGQISSRPRKDNDTSVLMDLKISFCWRRSAGGCFCDDGIINQKNTTGKLQLHKKFSN